MKSAVSPRSAAFVLATLFALAIAYDLSRLPIQVTDSLFEILEAQRSPSPLASFEASIGGNVGYVRPLRIAQIKTVFDVAQGHYQLAYRGFHVLLLVALIALFARALRVQTPVDFAAAAFSLIVLTGLHTFVGFVREAYPINHFLEVAVLCVAAVNLTQSRGGWAVDAAAALLFVVGVLTLESGLLVWVVVAAAWICGLRGVSTRGLVILTCLLVGYVVLRFGYLHADVPSLAERRSGFLLESLEPDELQRRFGEGPLLFYGYNVVASLLSVLVSEPRDGVFVAVRAIREADIPPRLYLAVMSSLATTALIVHWAIGQWRRRAPDPADRLALASAAVVIANAVLSFAYTKDEIVAVAGVFYAFMAYATIRVVLGGVGSLRGRAPIIATSILLFVLASAWSVRSYSVHHVLRRQAFRERNDWAHMITQFQREKRLPTELNASRLVGQLQTEALEKRVPNSQLVAEWNNRWFGD